jgi:hypothetical protein
MGKVKGDSHLETACLSRAGRIAQLVVDSHHTYQPPNIVRSFRAWLILSCRPKANPFRIRTTKRYRFWMHMHDK